MFDLIVIGAGSGGLAAAKRAAGYGKKVLLCENDTIGGTCVSFGCVPKKIWHGIGHMAHTFKVAQDYGFESDNIMFSWPVVQQKVQQYILGLNHRHETFCKDKGVTIVRGTATLVNATTISINDTHYSGAHILIAVGSTATTLDVPGSHLCDTSYSFFGWTSLPKRVAIIGGGYIAVELASVLNALGAEVHIIIRKKQVLRGFDADIRSQLQDAYSKRGITIHTAQTVTTIEEHGGALTVGLSNGTNVTVDRVIQAVGRHANTQALNCDAAGVVCTETGAIVVNDAYQTTVPSIYALGDCIDKEQLTPVAIAQARQWVDRVFGPTPFPVDFTYIPTAIFSLPEAACVGLTESDAMETYDTITTRVLRFSPLTLALTDTHKEPVLMKVVLEGDAKNVVGIHIIGEGAAEIVQSLAVAMQKGITKADLDITMALHPTVTEELVTLY